MSNDKPACKKCNGTDRSPDGRCRKCHAARIKKFRSDRPGYQAQQSKKHYEKNRDHYKNQTKIDKLKRKYGLDQSSVDQMILDQNNCCRLCGLPFEGVGSTKNAPVIDHDHETELVRGILHNKCNRALGFYEKVRIQAEAYLRKDF